MINILNWPIVRDFLINFLGISYVAKLNAKIESLGFFEKNIWSTSQGSVSHKLSQKLKVWVSLKKISGQLVKGQCHINCHEKRHLYLSVII
jgi:hypothetical protein